MLSPARGILSARQSARWRTVPRAQAYSTCSVRMCLACFCGIRRWNQHGTDVGGDPLLSACPVEVMTYIGRYKALVVTRLGEQPALLHQPKLNHRRVFVTVVQPIQRLSIRFPVLLSPPSLANRRALVSPCIPFFVWLSSSQGEHPFVSPPQWFQPRCS